MPKNKGFGKAQPKKEKSAFSRFWVVDGEVWALDDKASGGIKPGKTTSQYKLGKTAEIDKAIKELAGKDDGFYKFGASEPDSKPDWTFEELSATTQRSINATKTLIASKALERQQAAMG